MSPRKPSAPQRQSAARRPKNSGKRPPQTAKRRHSAAKRRTRYDDSLMHVFLFGIAVFLCLCAINLIGLTEYVEEPKDERTTTYQVGDPSSFFNTLGPIAEDYADYGLYPSVMLAQAALESNYGESQLSFDYNNYFGIKAHGHHRSVKLSTTEYYSDSPTTIRDYFCVYSSPEDCFEDYAELLTQNDNYSEVVGAASPAIAARALQEGGYATDPDYASKLISVINEYNLTRFDPMERPTPTKSASAADHSDSSQDADTTKEGTNE
ncbi:MAG: glycoside hydrolase family 73 protein [Peptococcaceae bacterium]|nr:glycoside hydrolase family 73 protein [Peptococcaceae bacterium]